MGRENGRAWEICRASKTLLLRLALSLPLANIKRSFFEDSCACFEVKRMLLCFSFSVPTSPYPPPLALARSRVWLSQAV